MSSQPINWPPLSDFRYISGRVATETDVAAGNAVFVLGNAGKVIGQPIAIDIPQYAIFTDGKTGKKLPCVIIQAEEASGQRLIGCRSLPDRNFLVGFYQEFEFLGKIPLSTNGV